MYQDTNSLLIQKKHLTLLLAMMFVAIASAIIFSAIIVNNIIKGQVAAAISQQPTYVPVQAAPAGSMVSTAGSSGCVLPGGQGGAQSSAATSSTRAFSSSGGLGGGHFGSKDKFFKKHSSKIVTHRTTNNKKVAYTNYVNSNNTIGSHNGSDNTVSNTNNTTNTVKDSFNQGSYNYAEDDFKQEAIFVGGNKVNETNNSNDTEIKPETDVEIKESGNNIGNKTNTETSVATSESKTINSYNELELARLLES